DNDGDGCIDEELYDGIDNDSDGYIDEDLRKLAYPSSEAGLLHPDSSNSIALTLNQNKVLSMVTDSGFWADSSDLEMRIWALSRNIQPKKIDSIDIRRAQRDIGGCYSLWDEVFDYTPVGTVFEIRHPLGPDSIDEIADVYYPLDTAEAVLVATRLCSLVDTSATLVYSKDSWNFFWGDSLPQIVDGKLGIYPEHHISLSTSSVKAFIDCHATPIYIGDSIDSDGDGCIDEEIRDSLDNDGDGVIDEDLRQASYADKYHNTVMSMLHPDSTGGELLVMGDSGRLLFTDAEGFWPAYPFDAVSRWNIIQQQPIPGMLDTTKLEMAKVTIGGCWNLYNESFAKYIPGTVFNVTHYENGDTTLKVHHVGYPLDSSEIFPIAAEACGLTDSSAEIIGSDSAWVIYWGDRIIQVKDSGLDTTREYASIISNYPAYPNVECTISSSPKEDKKDNDGDGCIDEELLDGVDNDGDGLTDEDLRITPYNGAIPITLGSLLHPDSISGDTVVLGKSGKLSFALDSTFYWADSSFSPEKRQYIIDLELLPGETDSVKVDTATTSVGGCWGFYKDYFK
ncbi:MAG: hypothetical protein HQK83_14335, partial [Fibrobacteria bacterium]|nr:hypothetical protein [Fibrobacteria bacterium]